MQMYRVAAQQRFYYCKSVSKHITSSNILLYPAEHATNQHETTACVRPVMCRCQPLPYIMVFDQVCLFIYIHSLPQIYANTWHNLNALANNTVK